MLVNLTVGLWVRLDAKPGREIDLEAFLRDAAPLARSGRTRETGVVRCPDRTGDIRNL